MASPNFADVREGAKTRKSVRDICDGKLKGFGVRVLPSGDRRYFLPCQHDVRRIWKIVGDADTKGANEA